MHISVWCVRVAQSLINRSYAGVVPKKDKNKDERRSSNRPFHFHTHSLSGGEWGSKATKRCLYFCS